MSARQNMKAVRKGMTVYAADGQSIGTVERMERKALFVGGRPIPETAVARVTADGVHLNGGYDTGIATGQQEGETRVAVAEERLTVGKREVDLGAVEIRKTVTEEQVSVPVTLRRDEIHVAERDVADRPLSAGEDAFQEGTIRVQLRGEEAVVAKEAVVTGEVVIDKGTVAEERQITDTIRKEHVDVDENYRRARGEFQEAHATRASGSGRTFEQAEPQYRAGYTAAHDTRHSGKEFEQIEPELQRAHAADGGDWTQLREEVREGWNKARK